MKTISSILRFALLAAAFSLETQLARADTVLDNPNKNSATIWGIGEPYNSGDDADFYWAQTFTTPSTDSTLQSLRFDVRNTFQSPYMGHNLDSDARFRVLLTTIATNGSGFHPGTILFESPVQTVPHAPSEVVDFQPINISFPNIALNPDTKYAFVLDAFSDAIFLDGNYPRGQVTTGNGYNGGGIFILHLPQGPNDVPVGTRADHFSAPWTDFFDSFNTDLAFRMVFVPEPSTLALCVLACLAAAVFSIRKKSTRLQ